MDKKVRRVWVQVPLVCALSEAKGIIKIMKIQFLNGGLGNQAFQYIFARNYALSHPGEVMYLDDSYFALNTVHNGYELEKVFGIKAPMLSECFSEDVWAFILEEKKKGKSVPWILNENGIGMYMLSEVAGEYQGFNPFCGVIYTVASNQYEPKVQELPGNVYYHGYWLDINWFMAYKDILRQEFCFPEIPDVRNKEYAAQIRASNSVSIHVRRGDFVTLGWAFDTDWYRKEVTKFLEKTLGEWNLFVFSDDILWCKEHAKEMGFERFARVTYVEGNVQGRNYIDMQLMSMCKEMILSDSTFCRLAALLNTRKEQRIH